MSQKNRFPVLAPEVYNRQLSSDGKYKSSLLALLCEKFNVKHNKDFRDQWIIFGISEGVLYTMFDARVEYQMDLLKSIPCQMKGTPQTGTLKIVNQDTFYLPLSRLVHINYPKIKSHRLWYKQDLRDNDGDLFSTYDWLVEFEDGTKAIYHNQSNVMDMEYKNWHYYQTIHEINLWNLLNRINP